MERLTFNVRSSRGGIAIAAGRQQTGPAAASRLAHVRRAVKRARERYDWDYLWMLAFTTLLFFRPQDHLTALESLHLAELTAIAGLAAMAVRRLRAGQTIAKVNREVIGVVVLGGIIVLTIPFSIWPGGSLKVFSDVYVKIILIFALMMSTITTPRRVRQMTWVMIIASGYIAGRGVFDYVRGVNLVEGNRLRGAVGGMFENPNDLALNLVTFLAPTLFIIIQDRKLTRRLFACLLALLMLAATVCTKSRSGFLGLVAMSGVVAYYTVRVKPGMIAAVFIAGLLALPVMPQSFWDRMDSIVNADEDATGSREARIRLLNQGMEVFAENPLTGIGAGQFQNYDGAGVVERWRVTHNVWLQVAAELGMFGLLTFLFLVVRAYTASFAVLRMLRRPGNRLRQGVGGQDRVRQGLGGQLRVRSPDRGRRSPQSANGELDLTEAERVILNTNAKGMLAAMVGWTVCSFFASVAFNWTFYYVFALAVAGREIAAKHRAMPGTEQSPATVPRLVRVHA